jgi:hypothetical protein
MWWAAAFLKGVIFLLHGRCSLPWAGKYTPPYGVARVSSYEPPGAYSPECVERLSEKVLEQRLERGFDRHTEGEKGLRVLCSATLQAPATLFGQSRKMNSQKFAVAISPSTPHSDGYRGGRETYVRLHRCKHLYAVGNIHNFAYLSIGVRSSSGRGAERGA